MTANKATRLSKIAREFNVGIATIVEFLHSKGQKIDSDPNTKISEEQYELLQHEYSSDLSIKKESEKVNLRHFKDNQQSVSINDIEEGETDQNQEEVLVKDHNIAGIPYETETEKAFNKEVKLNVIGKIDLDEKKKKKEETPEQIASEELQETKSSDKQDSDVPETDKEEIKESPDIEEPSKDLIIKVKKEEPQVKVVGKIDLDAMNQKTRPPKKTKEQREEERKARTGSKKEEKENGDEQVIGKPIIDQEEGNDDVIRVSVERLSDPTIIGKIELAGDKRNSDLDGLDRKKKRKRIRKDKVKLEENKTERPFGDANKDKSKKKHKLKTYKPEISDEDVQKQIKDTLLRLTSKGKSKGAKYRREKREAVSQKLQEETLAKEQSKLILKVTEFVTVNELATMMDANPTEIIATCMNLGLFVSINQRLDAETMALVAEEFGFKVEFVSIELQESIHEVEDTEADLLPRPPIVTVMGHVDHGKTKLLDYIRSANVVAGEAGGITQHIGAYTVERENGKCITFLDTPGHEAFTAMRARGAQITDVAIIVVAADDGVKPQTVEAINHAQAAGVPMVFAINKIDKPNVNPEKVKEELSKMNLLVEDWGGKYQSQEISAKTGLHVEDLLEKVLLEAEMLELKANPNKLATGTVVESSLDKGRGYVVTLLVQAGTMRQGDIILAGIHMGKIKAIYNERGKAIKEAGPSTPALILGLGGAPQAGDKFNIMGNEREAKEIANKREQLQREQGLRAQKHITLDEIGRRIAIGNFQEINIIVKGDVDGSVEALSDSLIKLSTSEIQVNIIHKAVGQISEGDVLLAVASNAIVVGFQVRPSLSARRLAEKEQIDIRIYSIIYNAIEEIRSAMEGMLSPEIKEEINATLEVLEVFKITRFGTVAGCIVREGKIRRDARVRVIRDGIVIYTGKLGSLKRFKDDAKEVVSGLECGLNIESFNDVKAGDFLEAFEEYEIKKKL